MEISSILRELRTEKKLTQGELAKHLGITQDSISLWEKGKRIPDTQYIIQLSNFFNVSTDYLLGRSDDLGGILLPRSASALTADEEELLRNYRSMTQAQQIRFVAYGEGLISAGDSVKKRS